MERETFSYWEIVEQADCRDMTKVPDTNIFFPRVDYYDAVDKAKVVCDQCPVEVDCLEFAITNNENYGIWGGKTELERKRIARERRISRRSQSNLT
jgi:WhiB family redox-sensing transcriptional regulator